MFAVTWAVLLLPVLGIGVSYLAETRRGIAAAVVFMSWLGLAAAVVLLGAVVAAGPVVHTDTLTFWSFQVVQTPFNATHGTVLPETFEVGLGYSATPTAAVLAVVVALVTLLGELQMLSQFRRDPRLGHLARLANLVAFGVLAIVLAPELFQTLVGFEISGLAAAMLVGSALGGRAGSAARSGYLIWRLGALSLLLGVGFIYFKFAGPIATAAAAAAAATKSKVALPTPDGLNLLALDHVVVAATKGLVHGVGGRSMTLAAVLIVVAAACACSQLPGHGLGRSLGSAPGALAGLVLALVGGVAGVALLLQTFPLLRWSSGVLPGLVVLATLSAVGAALLAFREQRLRRLATWLAVSQTALSLVAIGLGATAAGVALLVSSALSTAALMGVVSGLGRDQRVESIRQLGAAWRLARPTVMLLLVTLVATAGFLGLGTFFGHVAVLAAAFGAGARGVPKVPALFREVAAAGAILTMLLGAAAAARVALIARRGEESDDPREARLVRRQLAQGRGLGQLAPTVAATVLALLSGLVSLPGIGLGLGRFLATRAGESVLPWQPAALLVALAVPLLGLAVMAASRHRLGAKAAVEPGWVGWVDGSRLSAAVDAVAFGFPGLAVELVQARGLNPASDVAAAGIGDLARLEGPARGRRWPFGLGVSLVTLALVALTVALVIWAVAGSQQGAGLP
ncbi:MAG TPA: proton-conducting transporter membrane subunit [Candidatus Dormibacteraeota bacterium]